jgi:uncharacterized peroxidase-related enzyme
MSRYTIVEYDQVTDPRVKAVYDQIIAELGFGIVPNLFKSMTQIPGFLEANWIQFRSVILQGKLPRTLKEMIGVAISNANHSEYAKQVHLHGLTALGMSEQVLSLLVSDFENCPLPALDKAAIRFGLRAGTQPQQLTDADSDELLKLGLKSDEIFEIICTANLFTGVNQYTDAIGLPVDAL